MHTERAARERPAAVDRSPTEDAPTPEAAPQAEDRPGAENRAETEDRPATEDRRESQGRAATEERSESQGRATTEEPSATEAGPGAERGTAAQQTERPNSRASRRLLVPLLIAAVVAALGGAVTVRTATLNDDPAAANEALVDTDATARVIGDVSEALTKIFTYSHDDTAATEQAAAQVLAGDARRQYEQLFSQVKRRAPVQRLTVTTTVVRAGVSRISGGTARLLVFLDQVVTRGGGSRGTTAAAQLTVTAQLIDGHWRITGLKAG